ncbi:hypothetical protein NC652_009254 [Populus alba x Populus x berolinensis]|nr:hypothetical protein NC652_009254 [Populus alba x Populus x berolinensis]
MKTANHYQTRAPANPKTRTLQRKSINKASSVFSKIIESLVEVERGREYLV